MIRSKKGQEILEFALLGGLIFIASLGVVTVFGEKIAGFFSGNNATVMANHVTPVVSADDFSHYKDHSLLVNDSVVESYEEVDTKNVVNIAGRDFDIPQDFINTIEAAGIDGDTLYNEIKYLMSVVDNPEDVEFEINYFIDKTDKAGDIVVDECRYANNASCGQRSLDAQLVNNSSSVEGTAVTTSNVISIKAGDRIILIDKESECNGPYCDLYPAENEYRIEGTVNADGKYVGNVEVVSGDDPGVYKYEADVNLNGDINFENGKMVNEDPLIKEMERMIAQDNDAVRDVITDIRDGKYLYYRNDPAKMKAKELINEIRGKYTYGSFPDQTFMYQVVVDYDTDWNIFRNDDKAVLVGMHDIQKELKQSKESITLAPEVKSE